MARGTVGIRPPAPYGGSVRSARVVAEDRLVGAGLAGRRGVVGLRDVQEVDRVQPAAGIADLVACEDPAHVGEYVTVPGGGRLALAVQLVRALVEVGPVGRAQADAG